MNFINVFKVSTKEGKPSAKLDKERDFIQWEPNNELVQKRVTCLLGSCA